MKNDYVKEWMSTTPVTAHPTTSLPDAHKIMTENNIRRLPVVDKNNKLVGIVSMSDVREAEPSDATTLSIYELNYLLAKLTIEKVMTTNVVTVFPDSTIAQAAKMMLEKKIGGIPVVEGETLVGIITESDIFRFVVQKYAE